MTDRLSFWVVTALAATLALVLGAWPGGGWLVVWPFAIVVTLTWPAVLCTLLLARALVRAPAPRDLLWRSRRINALSGRHAWLLPAAGLVLWGVLRWSGAIAVSWSSSTSELTTSENWSTVTETLHELPMRTDERAGPLDLGDAPDELQRRFRSHFSGLGVPGMQVSGRIALELDEPFAAWPLWKSATREYRVAARLVVWQSTSPPAAAGMLDGAITGEGSWSMKGIATERDFHVFVGDTIGQHARGAIDEQLRKLVGQKR